jgi:hypothetical protein
VRGRRIGADLPLLAVGDRRGRTRTAARLVAALAAAQPVDLAVARQIMLDGVRMRVRGSGPDGDAPLGRAAQPLAQRASPVTVHR